MRSLLGGLTGHHARLGVLGIRARLDWGGGERDFTHEGRRVHVELCRSSLAVRAALDRRDTADWLVIVTDRTEADLGLGILARMAHRRLRTADPWEPVKVGFAANRVNHRLVADSGAGREIALGLLLATPADGWPPAPAGALTVDHAFGTVAAGLGIVGPGPSPAPIDGSAVLSWSARPDADRRIADLRARAGTVLTDAMLGWCAGRAGPLEPAWQRLLATGRASDLVPLGLVLPAVLAAPRGSGPRALLRRELGVDPPSDRALAGWAADAGQVTAPLMTDDPAAAARVFAAADRLLDHLDATAYAEASDMLDRSLRERLGALGTALHAAAAGADNRAARVGPDAPLVEADGLAAVEAAWAAVARHALAGRHPATPRAEAAVRLARWLAAPAATWPNPARRHSIDDAWVDRAAAAAWVGVDDDRLAGGLRTVLAAVRLRRDAHDRAFGAALAAAGGRWDDPAVIGVERLLVEHALPLARHVPVLLVIADGMSAANATQITDDVIGRYDGWLEQIPQGLDAPLSAVAALPSVTSVSRASLLCGEITAGDQSIEIARFPALCTSHGVTGRLLHKRPLDSTGGGFSLAADVAAAIDNVGGVPLVACVLNTIDDALDRSDPGGTDWTADTVKHLGSLLTRARRAGRVVILTSDHGHVIERRDGRVAPGRLSTANRWRPASGPPAGDGEVAVSGDRVVAANGQSAVLAVNERLRYSALKAGYHGGGAPAEVVIPVVLLAAGSSPDGWRAAPPQQPSWWQRGAGSAAGDAPPSTPPAAADRTAPTLFDVPAAPDVAAGPGLAERVLTSQTYRDQRARAGGVRVADDGVRALLNACLAAAGGAVDDLTASRALDVPAVRLPGALGQIQRLLNVEQYPVLRRDTERGEVIVDEILLREQFGLSR